MRKTIVALAACGLLGACGGSHKDDAGGAQSGKEGGVSFTRDATVGALYGSAGPRSCVDKKAPTHGAPSKGQAAAYVACAAESVTGDSLFLVDRVHVDDIAHGRPYNPNEDINMGNVDIREPVYAIRGGFISYQCNLVQKPGQMDFGPQYHQGSNCHSYVANKADGLCYKDTFGDWSCSMVDVDAITNGVKQQNVAPPA